MPVKPIPNIGAVGIIKDISAANIPEGAFTDAMNVRFRNGSVETIKGEETYQAISLNAIKGIHWPRPDTRYNVYISTSGAVATTASGTNVTLSSTLPTSSNWQVDYFGGGYAIFINNGSSTPLYCLAGDPLANLSFQPFPNWNYDSLTVTAKVIRPFNYSLVAANLVVNGTAAPATIRISVQAAIGNFPDIWKPGLTTDTADEFEVNTRTPIQDMLELRGNMFIYSNDSIHILSLVNGIANVRPYIRNRGVLAQNCVCEFMGNHAVLDRTDFYIHNGSGTTEFPLEGKVKDYLFEDMDITKSSSFFLYHNNYYKEIWICYVPRNDASTAPTKALIFNYSNGACTFRTLPGLTSIFDAPPISGASYQNIQLVPVGLGNSNAFKLDSGYKFFSGGVFSDIQAYIQRNKLTTDPFGDTFISGIAPILSTDVSKTITIRVSSSNIFDAVPDMNNLSNRDAFTLDPKNISSGYKVDPRVVGRFIDYKIEGSGYWKLDALAIDINSINRR